MKANLINIGDELLIGQVVNTNASKMSQMLTAAGIAVNQVFTIGDDSDAIVDSITLSLQSADAVLVTGGLGPTKDDITKKTLAELFDSELVENSMALDNVKRIFASRGYELTPVNRAQALVPRCCEVLNNDLGTAPCMWFAQDGKVVVSLPGVPFEMEWLMKNRVIPKLQETFKTDTIITKNILVQGIGESFLSDLIEPWELSLPDNVKLAYLPQAGMVKLRLTARFPFRTSTPDTTNDDLIASLLPGLYSLAAKYIVAEDHETLPEAVAHAFTSADLTLGTAESCTGGSLAARLTALPGASAYFKGGVVTYSNEAKTRILGVRQETLASHGAVSEETVREMAAGARALLSTDYAVATTGIAGPTGGTADKPVGTVWIGIASAEGVTAKKMQYGDRRAQTIDRTCNEVYASLLRHIR